jgi:alkaline phosphatase D
VYRSFFLIAVLILMNNFPGKANENLLKSGPMLCYSEMREVLLWVQTTEPAEVIIEYKEKNSDSKWLRTDKITTRKDNYFIAKPLADKVLPGKTYEYRLLINGEIIERDYKLEFQSLPDWDWKTEPPAINFAFGSCLFINDSLYDRKGKPYGDDYDILESIHAKSPDFMVWLGDNVYLREADWNSKTGIYYRFGHTRAIPEMQPLLGSVHHYAIWDDHDYGPNNSNRSLWNKELTTECFKEFFPNPAPAAEGIEGITSYFNWGDVDFFLMDNRYYRSPNNIKTEPKDYLGEEQLRWLIENLIYSNATFKIVAIGGQVLNPLANHENYATFPEERNKLLKAIEANDIKGVIFLSGDRHYAELTELKRRGNYSLFDFTSSSLTAGSYTGGCDEPNFMRVEGTCFNKHNFGMISVTGPRKDRKIKFSLFDKDGIEVWSKEYSENDFK